MRFACLLLVACSVMVAATTASLAQDKPKHPEKSGPDFATIHRVGADKDAGNKEFVDTRFVTFEIQGFGGRVYKSHVRRDYLENVKAFDGEGKKLTKEDMMLRMKEGTLVMVFFNELDPFYLAIAKKDALVLVMPSVGGKIDLVPPKK